jgi:hypothetical protein
MISDRIIGSKRGRDDREPSTLMVDTNRSTVTSLSISNPNDFWPHIKCVVFVFHTVLTVTR